MATYKIVGADRKEYGPVGAEEIRRWLAEGRLNRDSMALAEGALEWKPLSAFSEFADALQAQTAQMGQPPLPGSVLAQASSAAEILARPSQVLIGSCLSRSWKLLTENAGLLFGSTLVIWLISTPCQLILFGAPYFVLSGVLYGGLYSVFLKRIRGQTATIAGAFSGFAMAFAQLLLTGCLTKLLGFIGVLCCLILPGIYLMVAWHFSVPLVIDKGLEFWSAMELSRKVVTRVWFEILALLLLAYLPVILVNIIVELKISSALSPMLQEIISSAQPDIPKLVQVLLHASWISFPLMMLTKFVLLLNLPFALGALMYAYEDLFGTRPKPSA